MSGGDKILNHIKQDCDERIQAIKAKSQADVAEIINKAEKEAARIEQDILAKAEARVKHMNAVSKSRSELEIRTMLLKKRRNEIDATTQKILKYFLSLEDKKYFEVIYALAKKLSGKSGEVLLNKKDLNRLPSDFVQRMEKSGVKITVSENTADICGGFILKCGDIEENMDFSAIISEKRDEIEDLVNRELFVK